MDYSGYRKKRTSEISFRHKKLETQSNRSDTAIIFRANRITNVNEVKEHSGRRN